MVSKSQRRATPRTDIDGDLNMDGEGRRAKRPANGEATASRPSRGARGARGATSSSTRLRGWKISCRLTPNLSKDPLQGSRSPVSIVQIQPQVEEAEAGIPKCSQLGNIPDIWPSRSPCSFDRQPVISLTHQHTESPAISLTWCRKPPATGRGTC